MDSSAFRDALVFTGGGTGGHFFPATALAEAARLRWPQRPIVFVGAQQGIEGRRLPDSAWDHLLLDLEGLVGRSPVAMLRGSWKQWRAYRIVLKQFRSHRPWAVVGTGGYGAGPALLAARKLGVPYFLHESNAAPGRLIRHLASRASKVWCGMEAVQAMLPGARCLQVGTPVRACFRRSFRPVAELEAPFRLLVSGGSQGARALNQAIEGIAESLLERHPQWEILHQCGPKHESSALPQHPRYHRVPFLEEMDQAMEGASLVLSRSGASTCAELKAAGRPAILVPLPSAAHQHQLFNAQAMVQEGRAVLVEQGEAFQSRLTEGLESLMTQPVLRAAMALPELNRAVEFCLEDLEGSVEALHPSGYPGRA